MVNRRKVNHIATRHFRWRKQLCWLFRGVWKLRAKRIVSSFLPHISEGANILDIGAGSGMLAEEIAKRINVKFSLLDVIDWNVSRFPLMLFDGEHIIFNIFSTECPSGRITATETNGLNFSRDMLPVSSGWGNTVTIKSLSFRTHSLTAKHHTYNPEVWGLMFPKLTKKLSTE